jgi:hypothetical protein
MKKIAFYKIFIEEMLLSESYKNRLKELAGINPDNLLPIIKEAEDLYANSGKRVKFDINIMKQAIEGGMELGMVFQSDNDKYKMPVWKMRVIQPVAMGYNKRGELVIRGVHVEGQSEKKAIETGIRSAQAKNEWRLFKASNIKSMFFTGRLFERVSLPGYNPNDSAMTRILASFNPEKAIAYQKQLNTKKQQIPEPSVNAPKLVPAKTEPKPIVKPSTKPATKPVNPPKPNTKEKETVKNLEKKIDKLNKFL